jgi:regulator of sigma E protease
MSFANWLYVVVAVVLLFGASVFVHEFGHFWMARRCGLKVDGFSIGFGPKIFWWKRKGVEYAWRLIPAGGYVALPQMDSSEPIEGESRPAKKLPPVSPWSKMLVALAGPAMNIVFAFVLATAIYFVGLPVLVNPAVIGGVEPGSPEAKLGILAGDRVVAINGKPVKSWDEVQMTTALAPSQQIAVTLQRGDERKTYRLTARVNALVGVKLLNLDPMDRPVLREVVPDGAAARAGLQAGDQVVSFAGVPILGEQQLIGLVRKRPGQASPIEVNRAGRPLALSVTPDTNPATKAGILGVVIGPNPVTTYQVEKPGPPPWQLLAGVCQQTFGTIGALLHPRQTGVSAKDLSGPPGILAMLAIEVKTDYRLALKFMVLLNMSLGILNLLPVPLLDGGHIAMDLLEELRGRPLSARTQELASTVFSMLLICFMLYVSYNDVVRRFGLFKSMLDQQVHIEPGPASPPPAPPAK